VEEEEKQKREKRRREEGRKGRKERKKRWGACVIALLFPFPHLENRTKQLWKRCEIE